VVVLDGLACAVGLAGNVLREGQGEVSLCGCLVELDALLVEGYGFSVVLQFSEAGSEVLEGYLKNLKILGVTEIESPIKHLYSIMLSSTSLAF
jgi:hypothetical protein